MKSEVNYGPLDTMTNEGLYADESGYIYWVRHVVKDNVRCHGVQLNGVGRGENVQLDKLDLHKFTGTVTLSN